MGQLSLWDDHTQPTTGTQEKQNRGQARNATPAKENRAAIKCCSSADAMQKHIDAKHQSANNILAQPPTRKRLRDADGLRRQAIRLERIQETLRRLADMHVSDRITPCLANITTKSSLESALFTSPAGSEVLRLYESVTRVERNDERVLRHTKEAATMAIPGYFPTPAPLAEQLIEIASIESGNTILEPSAGTGNLIDAILKSCQDVQVSYCELNCFLLDILREKYQDAQCVSFLGRDCLDIDKDRPENRFDRVVMNPPFECGQDIDQLLHVWYSLMAPGGILTAIVSAGVFSRTDKKSKPFRDFLCNTKAKVWDVQPGSFKSSGTGVESKIVQVRACA